MTRLLLLLCLLGAGCSQPAIRLERELGAASASRPLRVQELRRLLVRLRPLHGPPDPPAPGSWLAHVHEPGQTFEQYLTQNPTRPTATRRTIYVLPIGELDAPRRRIVADVGRYLSAFFCLPVRLARPLPQGDIPGGAWRRHPRWGIRQVGAERLLDDLLRPLLPADAAALVGLTTVDLYPRQDWNYVFGMGSYRHRVAVVSMYRMGTPIVGHAESQRTVLARTLRIVTHETGHMLSVRHCIKHRCNMGGMNYTGELDRRPMELCPECLAKVLWATGCDPLARYRRLARFCRDRGLGAQAARFEALAAALSVTSL